MTKIENRTNSEVYMLGDNYIVVIPVHRNNVLCPDSTRRAALLDDKGNKIEYVFGNKKDATYGHGFPEPSRLELEDVIVNGKSNWTIGERYHRHVPCNVDKIACWLESHYIEMKYDKLTRIVQDIIKECKENFPNHCDDCPYNDPNDGLCCFKDRPTTWRDKLTGVAKEIIKECKDNYPSHCDDCRYSYIDNGWCCFKDRPTTWGVENSKAVEDDWSIEELLEKG